MSCGLRGYSLQKQHLRVLSTSHRDHQVRSGASARIPPLEYFSKLWALCSLSFCTSKTITVSHFALPSYQGLTFTSSLTTQRLLGLGRVRRVQGESSTFAMCTQVDNVWAVCRHERMKRLKFCPEFPTKCFGPKDREKVEVPGKCDDCIRREEMAAIAAVETRKAKESAAQNM